MTKYILSTLLCFMLNLVNAQYWQLTEDLPGIITDIEFYGNDRYITYKSGELFRNDSLIRTFAVQSENETGLHACGIWHDSLCVYLSSPDSIQRAICGTDTLLEIPYKAPYTLYSNRHRGGGFLSTPKILYVGVGSGNRPDDAQDLTNYRGKVVAIRQDTTYIYATGLRNPWKMDLHGDTLYIADVGDHAWEEVNRIDTSGLNLGWPCFEGNAVHDTMPPCGPTMGPLYTYPRAHVGNAIIGGKWFQGKYWWCDNNDQVGGKLLDSVNTTIPCPLNPTGMAVHGDTLFVYDFAGKIYRWVELPLSLDSIPPKEKPKEKEYGIKITPYSIHWDNIQGKLTVLSMDMKVVATAYTEEDYDPKLISLLGVVPGVYILVLTNDYGTIVWSKLFAIIH